MDAKTGITLGIEAGLNLVISGLLNMLCAWLLFRETGIVPVDFWSQFIDTTITCFLVSVCTAFFATASARRYRRQGLRISVGSALNRRLETLPTVWLPMGCCLFGICLPVLIAAFGIAFGISGTSILALAPFMAFKGIWGGLYGALTCTVIQLRHLSSVGANHHAPAGDASSKGCGTPEDNASFKGRDARECNLSRSKGGNHA